ncbi:hypothetical protein ACQEU3_38820 [Spirillospora sp. CA-253888]
MARGTLFPGKKAVSRVTYSVSPSGAKELQVSATPSGDYRPATWVGPAR